jgi:hypothetical protein
MELNKIKQRLERALRLEKPPTPGEVLEQVSRRGVLRGPVDWVFPAWIAYIEFATQEIIKTFHLSEEDEESAPRLQRHNEAIATEGVDADERKADDVV